MSENKTAKFVISGRLPGLNEIISEAQYNRYGYGTFKKRETRRCALSAITGAVPTFTGPVDISFRWIEPDRRRDPDNVRAGAKFILDALVDLRKLPGDGKKWVRQLADTFDEPDKKNPRIEVTITEVAGGSTTTGGNSCASGEVDCNRSRND